jgi:hypothetical protein
MVYAPDHPYCTKKKRFAEHRLVMEKKLGRYLIPHNKETGELVHHLNEIRDDNNPKNLSLETKHSHDKFSIKHEQAKRIRELEAENRRLKRA